MATTVAVIGSGALGLMAVKNFIEDGFEVTGFESRPYVGGLWKDSHDSTISVHATTRFNSSKYRAAYSDFPFPEDADDFPTAVQMHKYLTSYSEHFGLTSKIHTSTKVTGMERVGSKWALKVQLENGAPRTEYFDKVAVASGSFFKPKKMEFEGEEKFAGRILHSIDYHGPEPYQDQTILTIGCHASAQDVAASLNGNARRAYMSHRTGLILLPRFMPDGAANDTSVGLKFLLIQTFMLRWFPRLWNWFMDKAIGSISQKSFTVKPEWNFRPMPSMAVATPLVADKLYEMLQTGFAQPVGEVARITGPKSVLLKDGRELDDVDAIIQCTGYDFNIPFIPPDSPYQPYPNLGAPPTLYRNTFPLHPDPTIRNSLCFLGHVGIVYPGFITWELLIQSTSQIWQGKQHLPSYHEMQRWHRRHLAWRDRTTRLYGASSTFYAVFVEFADHIRWLDRTAGTGVYAHFDWAWFNPRSWRLWFRDPDLYRLCMRGVLTPTLWRLFDMGGRKPWSGAREQILRDNLAVERQRERKALELSAAKQE